MSYDVHVEYPDTASLWFNYTYNCSPMFRDVLPDGINGLDGLSAKDALPLLQEAIQAMEDDPDKYKAMNPINGWGNYEGALRFLKNIKIACAEHPEGTVRVR